MMKLCETCRYGSEYELDKPCIVYREDCPLYQKVGNEMSIKALEQEPNCPYYVIDDDGHGLCKNHRYIPTMYYPQVDGITPTVVKAEQEPSDDAISRQAVFDILEKEGHKWGNDYRDWVDAIEEIKKLPPVNPASNISIQITEREKYGRFN